MDDVRRPAQFAHGFKHAAHKEEAAFVVVFEEISIRVLQDSLALEVSVVVDEVHLNAGRGDGGHLDDQRVIRIVHVEVHAGKANDLMELVSALIDLAKSWHEHADFLSFLVRPLGQHARDVAHRGFREVGSEVLRNVEDAWLAHGYVLRETEP